MFKFDLKIIQYKQILLSKCLIKAIFKSKRGIIPYLSSGRITALIVYGHDSRFKIFKLKNEIRRRYHCTTLFNLLHSADDGLEYDCQFSALFPNLKLSEHTGIARIGFKLASNFEFKNINRKLSHLFIFIALDIYINIDINKVGIEVYYTFEKTMRHGEVYSYSFYHLKNNQLFFKKNILFIAKKDFNKKMLQKHFDWILYDPNQIDLQDFYRIQDLIDECYLKNKPIIVGEYSENLYKTCIGKNELKKAKEKCYEG